MLNKSISLSRQVSQLSLKSQFIFTWCIPHLDDFGLIDCDVHVIKAAVFPMTKEIRPADIEKFFLEASEKGLITEYQDCIEFRGFTNHQSISAEKRAKSKFPKIPKNPQESPVQEKGSKEKRREERERPNASVFFLEKLPSQDLHELSEKYKIAPRGIQAKAIDLKLYCESKGKSYRNYRAFLENALRKDAIKLRLEYPPPRTIVIAPVDEPMTAETIKKRQDIGNKMRELVASKRI